MAEIFKSYCISYDLPDKMRLKHKLSLQHICKAHKIKEKHRKRKTYWPPSSPAGFTYFPSLPLQQVKTVKKKKHFSNEKNTVLSVLDCRIQRNLWESWIVFGKTSTVECESHYLNRSFCLFFQKRFCFQIYCVILHFPTAFFQAFSNIFSAAALRFYIFVL